MVVRASIIVGGKGYLYSVYAYKFWQVERTLGSALRARRPDYYKLHDVRVCIYRTTINMVQREPATPLRQRRG